MSATWYVARDRDGSVSRVIRIHHEFRALRGEYLQDGTWVEDGVVLHVLTDDSWGEPVSVEEGEKIARDLGAAD